MRLTRPLRRFALGACVAVLVAIPFVPDPSAALAQSADADPTMDWSTFPGQAGRPHAPWVFRCTLDDRPRMLVAALAPQLWVAYDAQGCRFDRAWEGGEKGIDLEGSVYTGAHGPNPTQVGPTFVVGPESPFQVVRAGVTTPVTPVWRGYRIVNGDLQLQYDLPIPRSDGSIEETVRVTETLQIERGEDGGLFAREFAMGAVKAPVTVVVRIPIVGTDGKRLVFNGRFTPQTNHAAAITDRTLTELKLALKPEGTARVGLGIPKPKGGAR